jgi:succinate dehydrogenase / fumarate reductase cytochrome b subunit
MSAAPRRVLSPHLQVYRLPLNAWISILHRITGLIAAVTLVGATVWIWLLAQGWGASVLGLEGTALRAALSLIVFALAFHWAAGLRHLAMDLGWGFSPRGRRTGWWVPLTAVVATLLVWWV